MVILKSLKRSHFVFSKQILDGFMVKVSHKVKYFNIGNYLLDSPYDLVSLEKL